MILSLRQMSPTGARLSACRRVRTICSSVDRMRRIGPFLPAPARNLGPTLAYSLSESPSCPTSQRIRPYCPRPLGCLGNVGENLWAVPNEYLPVLLEIQTVKSLA